MKYFKNTELAKLYHVSEKSVRNWIEATRQGKLSLTLYQKGNKSYIANTTKNSAVIEELVKRGRKFKNTRGIKKIDPTNKFYKLFSQKQILDIISSIAVRKEIPLQYSYYNGGAAYWDEYASRLNQEATSNILTNTVTLLGLNSNYLESLIPKNKKINIVELGPGNGLPSRSLLSHFIQQGRLKRYIAIDDSSDMLSILKKNITTWFGDSIIFESYVRDFSYQRFDDLLIDDHVTDEADVPVTIVLFLGGTLSNFRFPDRILNTINGSLGANDILIYTGYLDTPHTRRYFDLSAANPTQKIPEQEKIIPDFLGLSEDLYEAHMEFNTEQRARLLKITPRVDLLLEFKLKSGVRQIELKKDDPILLWRHRHYSAANLINMFEKNDFELMQISKSSDRQYIHLISQIKVAP